MSYIQKYKLHYLPFAILLFTVLLNKMIFIFSYSLDNGGLEFYFVNIIQQLSDGKPLYPNPESYPYSNCLYTPVYFYLLSGCSSILNFNPKVDIHEVFVLARILSFLLIAGQCLYIFNILKKFNAGRFISLVAVSLYVLLLTDHIFAARPDALKLFFFSAFLYHFLNYHFFKGSIKDFFLSISFALLSVFSKQDIIVHIFICFAVVFFIRQNRQSFIHFAAFMFICLLSFILCHFIFGRYFLLNLFVFNLQKVNELQHSYLINIIPLSIFRTLPLLLLAYYNLKYSKRNGNQEIKFISITAVVLFFVSHILLTRAGANLNYTYELIFMLIINFSVFATLNWLQTESLRIKDCVLILFYVLFVLTTNVLFREVNINIPKLTTYQKQYNQYLADKPFVDAIIKEDTVFFPNTKYSVFYSNKQVVLGHDMHLDRFIELYTTNAQIKSELTFIQTKPYDNNFTNGTIKYLLIENEEKSKKHIATYYPLYLPFKSVHQLLIYKFSK